MIIIRKEKGRKPGDSKRNYQVQIEWKGYTGVGTKDYLSYSRETLIKAKGKPDIIGSSDAVFLGNTKHWNPEEMLVASLATCHELWFLALASINKISVIAYKDKPEGFMTEREDGAGAFESVILKPHASITDEKQLEIAHELHHIAHEKCFIANSVNFDVTYKPTFEIR